MGLASGYSASFACCTNMIGSYSGYYAAGVLGSNFIGVGSGQYATNSDYSNFIGNQTGNGATSASYSNFIGFYAGAAAGANNVGCNNTIIGTNITLQNGTVNAVNIGGLIFGTGSYATKTGNPFSGSAMGKVGLNQPTPLYDLDISGSVRATCVLGLTPMDPLPAAASFSGFFAVSASTPIKPYFSDGTSWNPLY